MATFGLSKERTDALDEIIDKGTSEIMEREDGFTPMEMLTAVPEAIGDATAEEIYYAGVMLGMYQENQRQHLESCRQTESFLEKVLKVRSAG